MLRLHSYQNLIENRYGTVALEGHGLDSKANIF
jgi:hypothetical protein